MSEPYVLPVSRLLHLREPGQSRRSYRGMGISEADISELFRLMRDQELMESGGDNVWPQLHAWRALAELQVPEVMPAALALLDEGDGLEGDQYLLEDLSDIAARVGPPALPFLKAYLQDSHKDAFNRWAASRALTELTRRYPALRDEVLALFRTMLQASATNYSIINTALIDQLIEMGDRDSIELIRSAMLNHPVEKNYLGSLEDIEFDLGYRDAPPPRRRAMIENPPESPTLQNAFLPTLQPGNPSRATETKKPGKSKKKR